MSFNKELHLRANIKAIKLSFKLDIEKRKPTNEEIEALKQFSGFGALKCVLNPANNLSDIVHWAESEVSLFPLVAELHETLKSNTNTEQEYKQYVNSLKNSILTAFYTPPEIVKTIAENLNKAEQTQNLFSTHQQEWVSLFQPLKIRTWHRT